MHRLLLPIAVSFMLLPSQAVQASSKLESNIEFAAKLPKTCNEQTGDGCRIQTMIAYKGHAMAEMFHEERYEQLETITRELCAGKRLPDGQPELYSFTSGFDGIFRHRDDPDAPQAQLAAWRKQHPRSIAAALAEASYWYTRAWVARGDGYARSVPSEAWELFRTRLRKASSVLEASRGFASACPMWHAMTIDTLLESGAGRAALDAAYARAVKQFPDAQQIHISMARSYSPKWGGSSEQFDQFARRAAQLSANSEGFGMYARIYWTEDCDCDEALSFGSGADLPAWPALRQGFRDLLKRYPQDLWNSNKFAALACRAGDGESYNAMRRKIGKHIYKNQWHSSYSPEVCDLRFYKKA